MLISGYIKTENLENIPKFIKDNILLGLECNCKENLNNTYTLYEVPYNRFYICDMCNRLIKDKLLEEL